MRIGRAIAPGLISEDDEAGSQYFPSCDRTVYVRAGFRFRMVPIMRICRTYNRRSNRFAPASERVGMFSLSEIDHVAWILFLLMGAWVAVNALVDLSGDRRPFGKPKDAADDRLDKRD